MGGAGFIGSHLCDRLIHESNQNFVCALDNLATGDVCNVEELYNHERFKFVTYDAAAEAAGEVALEVLQCSKVDDVYYLASIASPKMYLMQPMQTISANINGLINFLDLSCQCRSRFLYTSTSEIYGDPEVSPQPESYNGNVDPMSERAVYDETKRVGETIVAAYQRRHGVDTRITRIFNTYGPRMGSFDGRVVPTFMRQVLDGQPITIYGDGQQTRSFCYVQDTIEAIRLVMDSEQHEPFNVGSPQDYCNMVDLASMIKALVPNSPSRVAFLPLPTPNDPKIRRPDISKITLATGWTPTVSLSQGLNKMLEWLKSRQ